MSTVAIRCVFARLVSFTKQAGAFRWCDAPGARISATPLPAAPDGSFISAAHQYKSPPLSQLGSLPVAPTRIECPLTWRISSSVIPTNSATRLNVWAIASTLSRGPILPRPISRRNTTPELIPDTFNQACKYSTVSGDKYARLPSPTWSVFDRLMITRVARFSGRVTTFLECADLGRNPQGLANAPSGSASSAP